MSEWRKICCKHCGKQAEFTEMEIKAIQNTRNEWIPVSERLPEIGVPVFTLRKAFSDGEWILCVAKRVFGADGWLWAESYDGSYRLDGEYIDTESDDEYNYDYWRPMSSLLPAPPKGE